MKFRPCIDIHHRFDYIAILLVSESAQLGAGDCIFYYPGFHTAIIR